MRKKLAKRGRPFFVRPWYLNVTVLPIAGGSARSASLKPRANTEALAVGGLDQ